PKFLPRPEKRNPDSFQGRRIRKTEPAPNPLERGIPRGVSAFAARVVPTRSATTTTGKLVRVQHDHDGRQGYQESGQATEAVAQGRRRPLGRSGVGRDSL